MSPLSSAGEEHSTSSPRPRGPMPPSGQALSRMRRDVSRSLQVIETSTLLISKVVKNLLGTDCVASDTQENCIFLFCTVVLLLTFPFLHYIYRFSDILTQCLLEPGYVTDPLSSEIWRYHQVQQMGCPGCCSPPPSG